MSNLCDSFTPCARLTYVRSVKFRYLNYSDVSQDPLSTYGEDNIKQMRKVAAKYDPIGIFQRLVPGGFKISKVNLEPS